jgi:hypothetical protein
MEHDLGADKDQGHGAEHVTYKQCKQCALRIVRNFKEKFIL